MGTGGLDMDVEVGGVKQTLHPPHRLRRASKPVNMHITPMSRINPAFAQNPSLAGLGVALDQFASWSTRSLLKRPTVRLVFLVWIFLIHLGSGWLVLFHVHGLQHDKHGGAGGHIPH